MDMHNKRRELHDGDELSILDKARFIFRYPRNRDGSAFHKQYIIQGQLGKGHFATVYLATERSSGMRFAVKKFEKRSGPGERSKVEGLQQEIAVLMGVSHPNMLCLKDTFDEADGVYLVLELAPEGELFNWVVMKKKLSEDETRKVFVQLFQGIKYLVIIANPGQQFETIANLSAARAQHRTPRHQTRKHPGD
jgi:serine/threonine-protein kinase Chk2